MTEHFTTYMVFLLLGGMLIVAIAAVFRNLTDSGVSHEAPKRGKPIVPFVDFMLPDPVTLTPGVRTVGAITMVWSIINILLSLYWMLAPFAVTRGPESWFSAGYVLVASLIGLLGAIMLLALQAQGRRLIAWFGFLMVTLAFLGLGFALIRTNVGGPIAQRTAWMMAVLFGVHILLDTVVSSAAQHVGVPEETTAESATGN